jgi:proton-translocating NADH-quinone oxidoreductase chain N
LVSLGQTLWHLSPELVLLLTGGILLGLDALRPYRDFGRWMLYVALAGLGGALVATATLWGTDARILVVLSCDSFSLVINAITLVAMGLVALISSPHIGADQHISQRADQHFPLGTFYALLLLAALAVCLLGAAVDLVMLILALELFGAASYILLGYLNGGPRATEATVKYFLYSLILSVSMLYGLSWLHGLSGATDMATIATILQAVEDWLRPTLLPALILIMAGLVFKTAAAPFHQWLPDVYEGVSAPGVAFFAVAPMLAGIAALTRALLTMLPIGGLRTLAVDWRILLSALAALTMTAGHLFALWQQDGRRFLAYMSIAQVGYALAGIATVSQVSADGGAHILYQGITATLFASLSYVLGVLGALAAVIALASHTNSYAIDSYAGMHKRSPELAWPLLLCLLSLVGIPPTAGFVGRLHLFLAAIEGGLLWLAIASALNSVISLACIWRLVHAVFVAPSAASTARAEGRMSIQPGFAVALGIAAVGVLAASILATPLLRLLEAAARALFG